MSRDHETQSNRNGRFCRPCTALVLLCLIFITPARAQESGHADALDPATFQEDERVVRLKEMWRAMETEIVTADIEYLSLITAGSNFQPISADEFEELFLNVDFSDDPQRVFREEVAPLLFVDQHEVGHVWLKDAHFYLDGERTRRDNWRGEVHLLTADAEVWMQHHVGFRHIELWAPGASTWRKTRLEDFRFLPEADALYDIEKLDGDRLFLQFRRPHGVPPVPGHTRFVIDADSPIPERVYGRWGDGTITDLVIQRRLVPTEAGVAFPRIAVTGEFNRRTGVIRRFRFACITKVGVNVEIPADLFALATVPTDTIVDYRQTPHDPVAYKSEEEAPDVVDAEAPWYVPRANVAEPAENDIFARPIILLFVSLLALIAGFWLVYYRRSDV